MNRCRQCCIPTTRPDTAFADSGICSACGSFGKRSRTNWDKRKEELQKILAKHDMKCIVPSSGGKDSTWQVLTLLEMGADVTIVTATTCHLTEIGRHNIDNLARYARTVEVTPNRKVRAKLNRLGLDLVGDISWPEHVSIHRVPFRVAHDLKIPLVFFGECPTEAYGGPPGSEETREMTQRWASEFGGFLGLRAEDFVGMDGITDRDMADYKSPNDEELKAANITAYFLGQFFQWDSHRNAHVARSHGMRCKLPSPANWWDFENVDNAQTGLHDHAMYRKYGYGRLSAQVSVDVRAGLMTRDRAMQLIYQRDGLFPTEYMGVGIDKITHNIGLSKKDLMAILDRFTNWDLFDGEKEGRPLIRSWV